MSLNIEKILASIPSAAPEKRKQMRVNAEGLIESGDTSQRAAATRLLDALNAQNAIDDNVLRTELAGLDITERVKRAFTVRPMTDNEQKLIQVLLDQPNSTSSALTKALGWKAQSWHLHFGTMCANRALYLWPAPDAENRDGKFYSGILADLKEPENTFTIKPDAAAAFAQLGLRT
jgi:hypothetical protein